jgi:hypothetical protein
MSQHAGQRITHWQQVHDLSIEAGSAMVVDYFSVNGVL